MSVTIHSNGSRWAGEKPAPLSELFEALDDHVLDPTFERYGNFVYELPDGATRFWGNFTELSHVFEIDVEDDEMIVYALTEAIRANQRTPRYRELWAEMHGKPPVHRIVAGTACLPEQIEVHES